MDISSLRQPGALTRSASYVDTDAIARADAAEDQLNQRLATLDEKLGQLKASLDRLEELDYYGREAAIMMVLETGVTNSVRASAPFQFENLEDTIDTSSPDSTAAESDADYSDPDWIAKHPDVDEPFSKAQWQLENPDVNAIERQIELGRNPAPKV
ncbi:MAG: hypothetical protein ACRYGK_06690 [Janthinobacterium lividum]